MVQLNERITVINPGDQLTMGTDAVKIYLGGTMDFSSDVNDWQTRFQNGVVALTDPIKGILMFKNTSFIIINPHVPPQNALAPDLNNPEFCTTMQWRMNMMDQADVILVNLMNKSIEHAPLLDFATNLRTGKLIVRCGELYKSYPQVRLLCERYSVPLLNGTANVKDILLTMGSFVSKFQQQQPEQAPLPV